MHDVEEVNGLREMWGALVAVTTDLTKQFEKGSKGLLQIEVWGYSLCGREGVVSGGSMVAEMGIWDS